MPRNHLNSVALFSSCLQSFPASGSFLMSQFFTSGSQSIGASASVLPMNIQDQFPWTGLISLQSKGLLKIFSKPQFESINSLVLCLPVCDNGFWTLLINLSMPLINSSCFWMDACIHERRSEILTHWNQVADDWEILTSLLFIRMLSATIIDDTVWYRSSYKCLCRCYSWC